MYYSIVSLFWDLFCLAFILHNGQSWTFASYWKQECSISCRSCRWCNRPSGFKHSLFHLWTSGKLLCACQQIENIRGRTCFWNARLFDGFLCWETFHGFISRIYNTDQSQKESHAKCVSIKKISFESAVCQRQPFSLLKEVQNAKNSSNWLVILIPELLSSSPICPKCQTQCIKGVADKCHASWKKKNSFHMWRKGKILVHKSVTKALWIATAILK